MTASEAERKLRELSFLHEVAQLASSARDWDEMLRVVIGRTTDAMGAEVSSLYLLEKVEGLLRLVATNGLNRGGIGRATLRVGEGIVGWVANARIPLAARDVRTDPRWKWVPEVDEKRFTSMLSVPVVARDEVIGVMNVQTVQPREFGREEIDFLQTIANQVAGIIEKGRLQRESDRKLREVSALFEVSNVLTSTLDLDEVLSLIVDRLVRVYPGASGAIVLREEGEVVRERARAGELGKTASAAAQRALADFVAVVTHDLRTPLSVIRGHLEMLAEKNGKSKRPISEATSQVLRLDELVDRILAGVRTDRPELSLRRTRFDLRATVTAALKEVAPMARRHKLTGPRAGQPVFVRGDRRRTAEVVAGLVHNATKYAPSGTRIAVRIERAGDRAIVRVHDEGPGVPPQDRVRIFEPYARGAAHEEAPGSGIGLFASRRVVEAQGGDIWVEDPPGVGAVFAFSIPLARAVAPSATPAR